MVRVVWILGMLTAIGACGSGGSTSSDPGAAQVAFDSAATTLKGANVQAFGEALDEAVGATNGQIQSILARLEALEIERDALKERTVALESANVGLAARVQILEGKVPPEVDVLNTTVSGSTLPAGTVLSTLERLHSSLALLAELPASHAQVEGRLDIVENDLSAMSDCPDGTTAVGEFCVDSAPRAADLWDNAVFRCADSSGHLCTADEYSAACQTPPALAGGEGLPQLTSELVMGPSGYAGAALLFDAELCGSAGDPVDAGALHPYRCCYHRVVPGAGPPIPTN